MSSGGYFFYFLFYFGGMVDVSQKNGFCILFLDGS